MSSQLKRVLLVVAAGAAVLSAPDPSSVPEAQGAGRARRHTRHRFRPVSATRSASRASVKAAAEDVDPAEVSVGEELFLETRFAQFFAAHFRGDVNRPLLAGDPILDSTPTLRAPLPGAFAGKSMNCRSCHFVDDVAGFPGGSINSYGDFARKSRVPERDGRTETPRNSPPLVNAFLPRSKGVLLHFDGEFPSTEDLVRGTLTGRNFGWLPNETAAAISHIARVIRDDDGSSELAESYNALPYRVLLAGTDSRIPPELRLPPIYRLDVAHASDDQVVTAVGKLITAYSESLVFLQDADGLWNGSPYDAFLAKNGLPQAPEPGESDADYNSRLLDALSGLDAPSFVNGTDGAFELHDQAFVFGRKELDGLTVFLTRGGPHAAHAGNCVACHPAPNFTDFAFHNDGAEQEEYDSVHGAGAFAALQVPTLAERTANPEAYLPASQRHPTARGGFRLAASSARAGDADLGLWNVYANPDIPRPQARLEATLGFEALTPDQALLRTVALFKTPGLRDLGQSAPYFHTGRKDSLDDVTAFYRSFSEKARLGRVRNADPELGRVFLSADDTAFLAAFLRSLNEDYQ